MDFERLNGDIKEMRRRNRGLGLAVGTLAAGQILALVVILNLLGTVRTVVVPPSLNKTFWVTRDKASNEYLEQMGSFIAWLVLDVTPASIFWFCEGFPIVYRSPFASLRAFPTWVVVIGHPSWLIARFARSASNLRSAGYMRPIWFVGQGRNTSGPYFSSQASPSVVQSVSSWNPGS